MNKESKVSKREFWDEKYKVDYIPWDIGQVAPAFVKYFQNIVENQKNQTLNSELVAVLGCGLGHDAFYFANYKGCKFDVCGFDFSESAINFCNELKQEKKLKNVVFYQKDFFELVNNKDFKDCFDYVIEHTSLAAIDPTRRGEYINLIKYLLKPGGRLVGLFFVRPKELGGPPFGIAIEEVRELFCKDFIEVDALHYEECLHTGKLNGDEYFGVFKLSTL